MTNYIKRFMNMLMKKIMKIYLMMKNNHLLKKSKEYLAPIRNISRNSYFLQFNVCFHSIVWVALYYLSLTINKI